MRTDFLPPSRVFFPAARLISCGSRELNLGRNWEASKWECGTCNAANFQRVPFTVRRCPYSSYDWSLANLNDLNSPHHQKCQVIYAVGQLFCEEIENKTRWGRTGQSMGSAIHKNDFVSNSMSGWCEHRTTGQVCAQAYVCACKCVCGGNMKKLWKRWRREMKEQTGGLRTENIEDDPTLMNSMDSTSMPILFWSCKYYIPERLVD